MKARAERGVCAVCRKELALRKSGRTLRRHFAPNGLELCAGSHNPAWTVCVTTRPGRAGGSR